MNYLHHQAIMQKLPRPKGWFVYCYLRTASNLPYYIGLGSRPDRMTARHSCKVPRDWSRIRVMRQGLTRDEAIHWERFYIARYGRRDLGTGCLMNRTDGGDVANHSPATRQRLSEAGKRAENVARLRTINIGRRRPPHAIDAAAAGSRRRWERYRAKKGLLPPAERLKMPRGQGALLRGAEKHGVCPAVWAAMSNRERRTLHEWCRNNPGSTGADYLQGKRRKHGPAPKHSAERMRELAAAGWSRAAIARKLKCSQSYASRVLSGERQTVPVAPAGCAT